MFSSPDETGGVPKEWKMNVYDRGEAMGNYRLLTIPIFSIIRSFCTLSPELTIDKYVVKEKKFEFKKKMLLLVSEINIITCPRLVNAT